MHSCGLPALTKKIHHHKWKRTSWFYIGVICFPLHYAAFIASLFSCCRYHQYQLIHLVTVRCHSTFYLKYPGFMPNGSKIVSLRLQGYHSPSPGHRAICVHTADKGPWPCVSSAPGLLNILRSLPGHSQVILRSFSGAIMQKSARSASVNALREFIAIALESI
jgi:hypothetical protein